MTSLSKSTVKHVADLANLPITQGEMKDFQKKLSDTVNFIEDLKKIDTKNVFPAYEIEGKLNKLREDEVVFGLTQEQALQNAPRKHNGFFVVNKIWD